MFTLSSLLVGASFGVAIAWIVGKLTNYAFDLEVVQEFLYDLVTGIKVLVWVAIILGLLFALTQGSISGITWPLLFD